MNGARSPVTESASGLRRLLEVLKDLGIPFLIGGSLASSAHGVPRATMDVDLVADLKRDQIAPLADALGSDFYADARAMEEALHAGRSFNLIHYATSYKFDVFPLAPDPFHQTEFLRRITVQADFIGTGPLELPLATAEDTVLSKLNWYRAGGEVSARQWDDVLGVLRVSGRQLDMDYLRKWSQRLGIEDLLDRALSAASQHQARL